MAAAGVGQDPRLVLSHPSRFMASVYGLLFAANERAYAFAAVGGLSGGAIKLGSISSAVKENSLRL